ncbi:MULTISPECIES: hypothetical protein [Thalassospira]|uniref:hypothetical protein n=1 Tax=Thalassospira TaxID=168934 RepID=UPI001BAE7B17|nr:MULTISPECIES: hypothetical protein [Thalassospira]
MSGYSLGEHNFITLESELPKAASVIAGHYKTNKVRMPEPQKVSGQLLGLIGNLLIKWQFMNKFNEFGT